MAALPEGDEAARRTGAIRRSHDRAARARAISRLQCFAAKLCEPANRDWKCASDNDTAIRTGTKFTAGIGVLAPTPFVRRTPGFILGTVPFHRHRPWFFIAIRESCYYDVPSHFDARQSLRPMRRVFPTFREHPSPIARYADNAPADERTRGPGQVAPFDPAPQEVVQRMSHSCRSQRRRRGL